MTSCDARISNADIRRQLAARGSGRWASGESAPPAGIAPASARELWALITELAPTQPNDRFAPQGTLDVATVLRSATYQLRDDDGTVRRQWWANVIAYQPDTPGGGQRMLGLLVQANSTDQNPGMVMGVGTHHQLQDVVRTFNELCAAKRTSGYRARRKSGPGRITFADLAAAAATMPRR